MHLKPPPSAAVSVKYSTPCTANLTRPLSGLVSQWMKPSSSQSGLSARVGGFIEARSFDTHSSSQPQIWAKAW